MEEQRIVVSETQQWNEWKLLFSKSQVPSQRRGMLREGFRHALCAKKSEYIDKICFYLDYADGYVEKGKDRETKFKNGGVISEKRTAFEVLCQNLFKDTRQRSFDDYPWLEAVINKVIFKKILWFFRLNQRGDFKNLFVRSDERHDVIAKSFLSAFCKAMLTSSRTNYLPRTMNDDEMKEFFEIVDSSRLTIINMLIALDEEHLLLKPLYWHIIDDILLEHLEKLVLSRTKHFPDYDNFLENDYAMIIRTPGTIEEAIWADSSLAMILMVLKIKKQEQERHDKLVAAEKELCKIKKIKSKLL